MRLWLVVVVIVSPSGAAYLGKREDAPKRRRIPLECHYPGTHLIRRWSHQSTIAILLPPFSRREAGV